MRRHRACVVGIALSLATASCGARSGLLLPPESTDAGVSAPDAFDSTLPTDTFLATDTGSTLDTAIEVAPVDTAPFDSGFDAEVDVGPLDAPLDALQLSLG